MNGRSVIPILVALVLLTAAGTGAAVFLFADQALGANSTPAVAVVLGFIGVSIQVLLLALQSALTARGVERTQQLMDGHLGDHAQIEKALAAGAQAEVTGPPAPPPPPGGDPNAPRI